jgi:hypothetical protein
MNRRGFMSIMTLGAVGAPAMAMGVTPSSDSGRDGPICAETLQLQSGTKVREVKKSQFGDMAFYGTKYEEHKEVALAVGRDGNLWIRSEDSIWKRVVTE